MNTAHAPISITAIVSRGKNAGAELRPHVFRGDKYVVSMTRFEKDYTFVDSLRDVADYVGRGYSVRMSGDGIAASLIAPKSIKVSGI